MFGIFRFLLSIAVAHSHISGPIKNGFITPLSPDFNMGSLAVIGFYIISGYLMTAILKTKFIHDNKLQIKQFFKDRTLRIFPLYYFYTLLTIIFLAISGRFIFSTIGIISHLSIIPLNYYQLVRISLESFTINPLITPAWSLGSELQFYLLIPFILNKPRLKLFFYISSLFIFLSSAVLISEPFFFNYIFPLGTLFTFLTGSYLFDLKSNNTVKLISGTWISVLITFLYLLFSDKTQNGVSAEIFLGFLLLTPLIFILSKYKDNQVSRNLGNLAYPIFLSHSLADSITTNQTQAYLATFVLSIIGYIIIEKPFTTIRHKLFTYAKN